MASLFAESVTSNIKFTTKVPLLLKATSNDEKPTQGYDLQEICRISKSSLQNCQSLLSFLLGRLEKKDPRVKFKVLHLMKYLVINGHSEFRSQLSRNADVIKQTVNYKGELDSMHGDGLNIKVQQAASDLEKLLFDIDNPDVDIICRSMMALDDQSRKQMQGFGHTVAPEIKKETSFMETLMKVKESGLEIFNMNRPGAKASQGENEGVFYGQQSQYTPVNLTIDDSYCGDNEDDEICEEIEINSDYYFERKLVDNITAERGLTRVPSKEMLKDFVNQASSLELPVILDFLNEKVQDTSPNVQLKTLCVVEYLLRSNLRNISREVDEHCSSIRLLVQSQDETLQAKANKIVLAISSCLKQEDKSVSEALVPPSYNQATELPQVKDKKSGEADKEVEQNLNSLFSGMNLSTQKSNRQTNSHSSAEKTGARPGFGENRTLPDVNRPLIDIENTNDTNPPENSKAEPNTNENDSNSSRTEKHQTGDADLNLLNLDPVFSAHNSNISDGKNLKPSKTKSLNYGTQATPSQGKDFFSFQNNGDIMSQQTSTTAQGLAQNTTGLSSLDTEQRNSNSPKSMLQHHSYSNPLPSNDLLTFQSKPSSQTLPGGLVLSNSSPRRPFPKDMKSEIDGFDFIRKSAKADAFSFISDEIQARKTRPK